MKEYEEIIIVKLYERYPALEACKKDIETAIEMILDTYKSGGKIL